MSFSESYLEFLSAQSVWTNLANSKKGRRWTFEAFILYTNSFILSSSWHVMSSKLNMKQALANLSKKEQFNGSENI